ncbi:PREDICTED: uncharacterized protein LOC108358843 isoform X2 [Rhagoletis zephyria]|uniref:uncharacterized protein LOC108358843 isoform X2 n=1 Tax=Rhagoletis zephyria TaxID=28612 RepID=UPI0008118011|nr:PREDICTED: uncharacterized protein LOC108358843 isoform X2 [Rhagoletis zephyria]
MEKKLNRKGASNWEEVSERALIEVWSERIVELRGCRKNSHILLEMAQDLERQGYVYSVVELKNKMHNLTTRYRKEKQKVGPTGGSPSTWNLFQEMQSLLAPYKSYHTEGLLVDSVNIVVFNPGFTIAFTISVFCFTAAIAINCCNFAAAITIHSYNFSAAITIHTCNFAGAITTHNYSFAAAIAKYVGRFTGTIDFR